MTDPDRELVRKARRGDRRALTELYERHKRKLLGFLVKIAGERELAEDVFQEVWVKVLQKIDRYRSGRGSFRAWLFSVAANAAVDRLRREGRRRGPELDAPAGESGQRRIDLMPSSGPGPHREGEGRMFVADLVQALRGLSERQRAAVLLRHQQGLSYQEISRALGVAEGTAKTLVHRGLLTLRDALVEWNDDRARLQ